jgi:hypothetical protein
MSLFVYLFRNVEVGCSNYIRLVVGFYLVHNVTLFAFIFEAIAMNFIFFDFILTAIIRRELFKVYLRAV